MRRGGEALKRGDRKREIRREGDESRRELKKGS
jgi:hypothetical protein